MGPGNPVTDRSGHSLQGDRTGQGGCRSSFLEPPARSLLGARAPQSGKPAVEAVGAADAEHASTAPWKTAKHAVSHRYHRPLFFPSVTQKVLPMFPVNSVTYVPGCTARLGALGSNPQQECPYRRTWGRPAAATELLRRRRVRPGGNQTTSAARLHVRFPCAVRS